MLSHPKLDLFEEYPTQKHNELFAAEHVLANIGNLLFNGTGLIPNRAFDRIGFNVIRDDVFRKLVLSRLSYPAGKASTSVSMLNIPGRFSEALLEEDKHSNFQIILGLLVSSDGNPLAYSIHEGKKYEDIPCSLLSNNTHGSGIYRLS